MIINISEISKDYDIVIVGAGITGLALGRLLDSEKYKVLVIEAGNFKFNKKANKNSYAKVNNIGNWPVQNYASYHSRVRMFGGNANVWGGWCMELDEYDYNQNMVWNSLKNDLKLHYKKAYEILNINPKEISKEKLNLKSVEPYVINVSRGNFISESKKYFESNKNIDLLIETKLTKLNFEENKVTSINIKNLKEEVSIVNLKQLIISTGGIETTKILLNNIPSQYQNPNLGKNFMEHPQLQVGRVTISNSSINKFIQTNSPPTAKHLFDDKLNIQKDKYFSGFKSTDPNIRNYFVLRTSDVYQSKTLYRLRHIILTRTLSSTGKIKAKDIIELINDLANMFIKKIINSITRSKSYSVVLHLEQKPSEVNQIFIDNNNDIVLDWNFTDEDLKNLNDSIKDLNKIFHEMESKFDLKNIFNEDEEEIINYLEKNIFGIGHHMGTTRIGLNKEGSVCDINLKHFDIDNLFINSTSVFPSGGIANPTLTMLALTSRLAEKLNNE